MLTHELTRRGAAVVQCVGSLNQVASTQLHELVFADVSITRRNVILSRLVRDGYLMRVGRRAPGLKGGNAPMVYQLGPVGWRHLGNTGKYWKRRAVSEHSLITADMFTRLVTMDRAGIIKLLAMEPEYRVGQARADLFVDAGVPSIGKRRVYCLEVQRSSRRGVIENKIAAYRQAFEAKRRKRLASDEDTFLWPLVVFVALDEEQRRGIARQVPAEVSEWVRVWEVERFFSALVS